MTADERMTITERRKYLTKMQTRYRAADRPLRGQLLTEMEAITGMHRKSLTRLIAQRSVTRRRRQTQGVYYNLFQPVLHLIGKEVIAGKLKRRWDSAQTPSQRRAVTDTLTPTVAQGLAALHTAANPRRLRQQMYDALARLWESPTPTALAAD